MFPFSVVLQHRYTQAKLNISDRATKVFRGSVLTQLFLSFYFMFALLFRDLEASLLFPGAYNFLSAWHKLKTNIK